MVYTKRGKGYMEREGMGEEREKERERGERGGERERGGGVMFVEMGSAKKLERRRERGDR